jgi:isopenicillin N synthase-like dioxygenase
MRLTIYLSIYLSTYLFVYSDASSTHPLSSLFSLSLSLSLLLSFYPSDLAPQIMEAFGPLGLGLLVVSNVPNYIAARKRLLPLSRTFASLPDDVKLKYEHPASHYNFGWSHGKETFNNKPDYAKGSYYANPLFDRPFNDEQLEKDYPSFAAPNIWPSEIPEFEPAFKELGQLICDTGRLLAKKCDKVVKSKLPNYDDRLSNILRDSRTCKARLLHYFPMKEEESKDVKGVDIDGSWCGWHNDHGSLTGLTSAMFFNEKGEEIANPDKGSGLYVRSRKGETIKINIPADSLAFQIGETATIHSCGVLQATPHCVMGSSTPNISRETFAVFMEPEMFEPMAIPSGADVNEIVGGTNEYLPKGVPPLKIRWKNEFDFGTFTNETLAAYHPKEEEKAQ